MTQILAKIKGLFIPHEGNNFRPEALEVRGFIFLASVLFLFEAVVLVQGFYFIKKSDLGASVFPEAVSVFTNYSRIESGEKVLTYSKVLSLAAEEKAKDMASRGYFSHKTPEGEDPWIFLDRVGYKYSYAGENLATNFSDSSEVVKAWENSPSHKENLLNPKYQEIGVGVATGKLNGKEATFVVEFFGTPAYASTLESESGASSGFANRPTNSALNNTETAPFSSEVAQGNGVENSPRVLSETVSVPGGGDSSSIKDFIKALATSPKMTASFLFESALIFMFVVLALAIFVRFEIQHKDIISRGLALVVLIFVMFGFTNLFLSGVSLPADGASASVILYR